jgi:serine-type D-Ala-D-Ala carboxypeptidase (penicillin-binding protein 5/6)
MFSKRAPKFSIGLMCFVLTGLLLSLPVAGPAPPVLDSPSYLVMDPDTGNVIYGKAINAIRAPASTTKIMTILLALELGNPNDMVTVSHRADCEGSTGIGICEGEKIPLYDLCKATIVKSGNDGAVAIAEHIGGSISGFADIMNRRAKKLGMKNTHFENPNGLPNDEHHSTAYDLSLLAVEAMKHKEFRDWVSMTEVHFDKFGNRTNVTFESTNRLLDMYPFATGIKTGYTDKAGYCLVASATFRKKTFIAVILGCERNEQWPAAIQLFDYAFTRYDPDFKEFRDLYKGNNIF